MNILQQGQRGMVLFIALIVLVAMTLAGIGMVRSVDTTNVIAGNLAFKQGTALGADVGINAAVDWLLSKSGTGFLPFTHETEGYYSSIPGAEPDWSKAESWVNQACLDGCNADATTGNIVSYKIHRMCTEPNTIFNGVGATGNQNQCGKYDASTDGTTGAYRTRKHGESSRVYEELLGQGGGSPGSSSISVYYRVTVRVRGPRDTLSIVQAMVMLPE